MAAGGTGTWAMADPAKPKALTVMIVRPVRRFLIGLSYQHRPSAGASKEIGPKCGGICALRVAAYP
ncbi:hypothetical protein ASE49_08990 [Novosphingobium sp. Leaf2]|nr:hypothetical protein ASE49_08990 [Novosphingobium sp. Leaf2]